MIELSTPNRRKSRARRLYSVTRVAMALVDHESSRLSRLLRALSGLRTCRSRNPTTTTLIAATGSTATATANSPTAIMSDWTPDETLPTMPEVADEILHEEVLKMAEPIVRLKGPIGLKESVDESCTSLRQRLL